MQADTAAPVSEEDVGQFGPYYILQGEGVVEVPRECIVRDRNLAFAVSHQELLGLAAAGWAASFEASTVMATRPLKSSAVVVLSDRGQLSGRPNRFTWCIKILFRAKGIQSNAGAGDYDGQKFGQKLLWPISPASALNAFDKWKLQDPDNPSRLLSEWKPCPDVFDWRTIPGACFVDAVDHRTRLALQCLRPPSQPAKSFRPTPLDGVAVFAPPVFARSASQRGYPCSGGPARHASELVFAKGDARLGRAKRFRASEHSGFAMLTRDARDLIWNILVHQALDTPGGARSQSFQTWLTLRQICRESKTAIESGTFELMHYLHQLSQRCSQPLGCDGGASAFAVHDAIALRNELIPRGILATSLRFEFERSLPLSLTTLWPYVRLRTRISWLKPVPEEVTIQPKPADHLNFLDEDLVDDSTLRGPRLRSRADAPTGLKVVRVTMRTNELPRVRLKLSARAAAPAGAAGAVAPSPAEDAPRRSARLREKKCVNDK